MAYIDYRDFIPLDGQEFPSGNDLYVLIDDSTKTIIGLFRCEYNTIILSKGISTTPITELRNDSFEYCSNDKLRRIIASNIFKNTYRQWLDNFKL